MCNTDVFDWSTKATSRLIRSFPALDTNLCRSPTDLQTPIMSATNSFIDKFLFYFLCFLGGGFHV